MINSYSTYFEFIWRKNLQKTNPRIDFAIFNLWEDGSQIKDTEMTVGAYQNPICSLWRLDIGVAMLSWQSTMGDRLNDMQTTIGLEIGKELSSSV